MGMSLFSDSAPSSGGLFTAAAGEPDGAGEAEDSQAAEGPDVTGEEDEQVVFRAEGKLWKLVRSAQPPGADAPAAAAEPEGGQGKNWRWQERGCGVVHINRHGTTGAGRLVMRMRGVLKLLLNTPVFPTTKYEKVGQKSVKFVGVDADAKPAKAKDDVALTAFRLNLQSSDQQEKFLAVLSDLMSKH